MRHEESHYCRHREKPDADRYCANTLMIILGPVADWKTFGDCIIIGR
jgi:hypothetical protein